MLALLALYGASAARAGAQTDGSAGRVVTLSGAFTVPQTLGTVAGGNLFHSFQSFGVRPGESATFTTSTPLVNVIARVTGGTASVFNGPLRLDAAGGGSPALFFINPAGITLGAGSSVDVPGALHLSTASQLKMADGTRLRADLGSGSSFSAAAPEAFGFLGSQVTAITINDQAALQLQSGHDTTLTAGELRVDNASLTQIGGNLRLAAVGTVATDVALAGALPAALAGQLTVDNGALLLWIGARPTDRGEVNVAAGDVLIGSAGGVQTTGISSLGTGAGQGSTLRIHASRQLTVQGGGSLVAYAEQASDSGAVDASSAGNLRVGSDGFIGSFTTGSGRAGAVRVSAAGTADLDGGGSGASGNSNSLQGAAVGSESSGSGSAGSVTVTAGGAMNLLRGGRISSSSFTEGAGGLVRVEAASLTIDNQGSPVGSGIVSNTTGSGVAGAVEVQVSGALNVVNGGQIQSSTYGSARAGGVSVQAGSVRLRHDGGAFSTGIASETSGAGDAGTVSVVASGDVSLQDSARISSSSFAAGSAGSVKVSASTLTLDGQRNSSSANANTNTIGSIAKDSGRAGTVDVAVRGLLSITSGFITTSTEGPGAGGSVNVSAGNLAIGDGTALPLLSGITSDTLGLGNAGAVQVQVADLLTLRGGGIVSSSTYAQGQAGAVTLNAARIQMNGSGSPLGARIASDTEGSGAAGRVDVTASGELAIGSLSVISSSAYAEGNAGLVRVRAATIRIDAEGAALRSGIGSVAFSGSGHGGSVDVAATGLLALSHGGEISSNTSSSGSAGAVQVVAERITVDSGASINSGAAAGSSGQTGSVAVRAGQDITLTDGRLSIENQATVAQPAALQPTTLAVAAPRITLLAGAEITASATGNVGAGNIAIEQTERLLVRERSAINTSAVSGQGGGITVGGGGLLWLDHARLTTSVTGTRNGDGGPIHISAPVIVLDSGFVQANTAVADARGGDVAINVDAPGSVLIASGAQLITGGQPVRYQAAALRSPNVIQAARPDGVNGSLQVTSPRVDLASSLVQLAVPRLDFGALGADLCRIGEGSSLTPVGNGALPPAITDRVRPAP